MTGLKLAVNFSPPLARLVESGAVQIDLFKVPDWPDLVEQASELGQCYVHFPTDIGATRLGVDLAAARELMLATGTEFLNGHLAPSRERFPHIDVGDVSPAALGEVTEALASDVGRLADVFGAENVIVENVPYRGERANLLRAGVEARVIADVVASTGCGLLLDLSHAVLTTAELGCSLEEYLDALPGHALVELHVSGVMPLEGRLRDHMPLTEEDFSYLRAALGRIRAGAWPEPAIVAFEYGGVGPVFEWRTDESVLADQVPRLVEMLSG